MTDATEFRPGSWRLVAICALAWASAAEAAPSLDEMRREVSAAKQPSPPWGGPVSGPPAARNESGALLCEELRIRARVFQVATVAEPLTLHGWQLVDELNRLLARARVSGYVVPVHLSTLQNIAFDGGPRHQYDPDNGYRDVYRRMWGR